MPQAWKQEVEGSEVSLLCKKPLSLLTWGPRKLWNASPGGDVTYISVVTNPVSSERKRKRMKRQQQIETGRNNTDTQLRVVGTDGGKPTPRPCPQRKVAYREGDRGPQTLPKAPSYSWPQCEAAPLSER